MARDQPAYADAGECTRDCCCRECKPDLSDDERRAEGLAQRRACGCELCVAGILARA